MATEHEVYTLRATEARREAEIATLDNVRQRCLRAAAAWEQMAARAGRTARMRADAEAAKMLREAE